MTSTVHVDLDPKTEATLKRITARLGWSRSKVVREGIHLVEQSYAKPPRSKIIDVGEFDTGIPDLATNQKYLEGFGAESIGRDWRKPAQD